MCSKMMGVWGQGLCAFIMFLQITVMCTKDRLAPKGHGGAEFAYSNKQQGIVLSFIPMLIFDLCTHSAGSS